VIERRARHVIATGSLLELALAALALALGAITAVSPLGSFSWNAPDAAIGALATLPLIALFRLAWTSRAPALRKIRDELERVLPEIFGDASTAGLAMVSLAAGIGEEMLFRGFLQAWLETMLGSLGGLLVASFLFGAAHPITAGYVVIATLMGGYLGWLWQASGNLLVPIVTHALYDLVVLRLLVSRRRT
jgi:membrane protease YdiL (CAAX protease family)